MSNKVRCVIVDDEPRMLKLFANFISKLEQLELVFATTKPADAANFISIDSTDIVIIDIQIPEVAHMQLLGIIPPGISIIVTSAHPEYAFHNYDHHIADYLLRPINFRRFCKAIERAIEVIGLGKTKNKSLAGVTQSIFIKTEGRHIRVLYSDILFIRSLSDYIAIETRQGKLISLDTLAKMESVLPEDDFIRIHKSYIVALNKIDIIDLKSVSVAGFKIPVVSVYRKAMLSIVR